MTQYNILNVKLSNSQLNKLKSGMQNGTEVTLNLSSNDIDVSNEETSFPHKLRITDAEVSRLHKAFANNSSANIKILKTQLSKIVQLGRFFPLFETMLKAASKIARVGGEFWENMKRTQSEKDVSKPFLDAEHNILNKKLHKL